MATYTRTNAWNNNGTFANPDLLWYAKGVGAMQSRALDDPSSWWFFAAIHGEYVADSAFPGWRYLPQPPNTPTSPTPSPKVRATYWDQCQHQTWYFLPWHRGYLLALEAQIRAAVLALGGPADWALPYWNYFGAGTQAQIPPAFTQTTLPDGTPNPLFVKARYGPKGDGNIYVPIPPLNENALTNDLYTGTDAVTPPPGFGGPTTGFSHDGDTSGNLESNPHNLVHVYVGGSLPSGAYGLMADPGIAALDPIFYLHHCNIDRMWASWNDAGNANPTDPAWLRGPAAQGQREFVMPMPPNASWVYTPADVDSLDALDYSYDSVATVAPARNLLAQRLTRLGAIGAAKRVTEGAAVTPERNEELVGANQTALPVKGTGASATVGLAAEVRRKLTASLRAPTEAAPPDRVMLHLENVRGTHDATALSVYVAPASNTDDPRNHPELLAGTVGLFGLRRSSRAAGDHAGNGLTFVLDITRIIDTLHLRNTLTTDALRVSVFPNQPIPDSSEVTIGRLAVYRLSQ